MSGRHAGVAAKGAKLPALSKRCGGSLKMSGRHAGVAARDAKTSCLEPN